MNLDLTFDIAVAISQVMSLVFAIGQCIHLSTVILYLQKRGDPEREMGYDKKQKRLHFFNLIFILFTMVWLLVSVTLEIFWHTQSESGIAPGKA